MLGQTAAEITAWSLFATAIIGALVAGCIKILHELRNTEIIRKVDAKDVASKVETAKDKVDESTSSIKSDLSIAVEGLAKLDKRFDHLDYQLKALDGKVGKLDAKVSLHGTKMSSLSQDQQTLLELVATLEKAKV